MNDAIAAFDPGNGLLVGRAAHQAVLHPIAYRPDGPRRRRDDVRRLRRIADADVDAVMAVIALRPAGIVLGGGRGVVRGLPIEAAETRSRG